MQPVTAAPVRLDQMARALDRADAHLDPAYQMMKLGRMALGDAPISFGSTAIGHGLKLGFGPAADAHKQALGHASLAADGVLRGLFYTGGILHGAAARKVPWLVVPRTPPAGFAGIASRLSKVAHGARLGLLGISGVLGAIRAAKAVVAAQGDPRALLATRDGRGGALQAVGSALLMVKHPATYLAGGGLFLAAMVNDFL